MISIIAYANYKVIRKVKFDSIDYFLEGQPIYKKEHIKKTYHTEKKVTNFELHSVIKHI